MLVWIALGWLALGIATAAAFHLMRQRYRPVSIPREVQAFVRRVDEIVRAYHPQVTIRGLLPGRFTMVFEVHGQEVPVPLHQLFRHASAFPESMPQMVDTLMREIENGGLTRIGDHRFEDVATRILPQVRAVAWVSAHSPAFGDAALVTRALAEDLRVCYVVDDPWSMVFVCRAHLRQWGIDAEAVHVLAQQNLRRLSGERMPVPESGAEPVMLRTGDGYDAARVLLLDPEQAEGLLVALPERDTLWLSAMDLPGKEGPRKGTDVLAALMAQSREHSASSPYPVSPTLYRFHHGRLEAVRDAAAE